MGKSWDDNEIKALIELIKQYEKIWNTNHPDYTKNKRLRHKTWKEITSILNDSQTNSRPYTSEDVFFKWNNLRLQFKKEQKKQNDHGERSCWRFYSILSFLPTHSTTKSTIDLNFSKKYTLRKSIQPEEDDETDIVSVGSISPGYLKMETDDIHKLRNDMTTVKRFKAEKTQSNSGLERHSFEAQKSFGDYIAEELTHLETDLQFRAKKIIFDILMDLQFEQERRKNLVKMQVSDEYSKL